MCGCAFKVVAENQLCQPEIFAEYCFEHLFFMCQQQHKRVSRQNERSLFVFSKIK